MLFSCFLAQAAPDYYGKVSTEAMLEFNGRIEIATLRTMTVEQLNSGSPRALEVRALIDQQLSHLIGHFQSTYYSESGGMPGVLGEAFTIKVKQVGTRAEGHQLISYSFKSKVNFHSKIFKSSKNANVVLRMPLNPQTIYSFGMVGEVNRCTDAHYNSEVDFFYFWDPEMEGCPLSGNEDQVVHLEGKLSKLENTVKTYPEYDRLYNSEPLTASVFIGYIDEVQRGRVRTSDAGYQTYKELKDAFTQMGYELNSEKKRFMLKGGVEGKGNAYFAILSKTITNGLGFQQKVLINLMLADSQVTSRDQTFETYYVEALENSNIVLYDGHSGLGGNLDLASLPTVEFNNKYQIFFLNGCSSYPYFNLTYFEAKPGSKKNLEILTSGLPTMTNTSFSNSMAFLTPFLEGKVISYQTLLNRLENSNQDEGTYLMGINGDEDNRFLP